MLNLYGAKPGICCGRSMDFCICIPTYSNHRNHCQHPSGGWLSRPTQSAAPSPQVSTILTSGSYASFACLWKLIQLGIVQNVPFRVWLLPLNSSGRISVRREKGMPCWVWRRGVLQHGKGAGTGACRKGSQKDGPFRWWVAWNGSTDCLKVSETNDIIRVTCQGIWHDSLSGAEWGRTLEAAAPA